MLLVSVMMQLTGQRKERDGCRGEQGAADAQNPRASFVAAGGGCGCLRGKLISTADRILITFGTVVRFRCA
jgi:hypothetical protein